jgi:hypothetical protein
MSKKETFTCAYLRAGVRISEFRPGVRVSKHFALVNGALTHIPSGYMVPHSQCETLEQATSRAERLEALTFVDWRKKDPTTPTLTDAQLELVRVAAQGATEVANG